MIQMMTMMMMMKMMLQINCKKKQLSIIEILHQMCCYYYPYSWWHIVNIGALP